MLAEDKLNKITEEIVIGLKEIFGNKLNSIILFGSYARGDFDEESDVDILVLVDLSANELSNYRASVDSLCGKLLLEYGIVISAIEKDFETYNRYRDVLPFYKNIVKDGVKIA